MPNRSIQVIQVDFATIPRECVVVATVTNSFVVDCVVFNWHPLCACRVDSPALKQLTFLNLQVNDAVLLEEANSCHDPVWGQNCYWELVEGMNELTCCWWCLRASVWGWSNDLTSCLVHRKCTCSSCNARRGSATMSRPGEDLKLLVTDSCPETSFNSPLKFPMNNISCRPRLFRSRTRCIHSDVSSSAMLGKPTCQRPKNLQLSFNFLQFQSQNSRRKCNTKAFQRISAALRSKVPWSNRNSLSTGNAGKFPNNLHPCSSPLRSRCSLAWDELLASKLSLRRVCWDRNATNLALKSP